MLPGASARPLIHGLQVLPDHSDLPESGISQRRLMKFKDGDVAWGCLSQVNGQRDAAPSLAPGGHLPDPAVLHPL
jgi:hypothetical protein